MTNMAWARQLLEEMLAAGIDEFIICPGARNAPLVKSLSLIQGIPVFSFFEERAAGFFAMGRAARTLKPKAVITTSGTAVANLLPSIVEAHYAGLPLVIISADRPKTYRGTGAPQTIVQPGIFSTYAVLLGDWERGEIGPLNLPMHGPSHLNLCFDEPLLDEPISDWRPQVNQPTIPIEKTSSQILPVKDPVRDPVGDPLVAFRQNSQRTLIVVGGLRPDFRESVRQWLRLQSCPIYLEACSGLRGDPALVTKEIKGGDSSLMSILRTITCDGVLRIGQVPTTRAWRDLETSPTPVLSLAEPVFSGMARASDVVPLSEKVFESKVQFHHPDLELIGARDQEMAHCLTSLLLDFPESELAWMRRLSEVIQADDSVYLGNSLPIREWDLAARRDSCFARCFANRGANGIDGQLSTFFGWACETTRNWAIVGDLTALYDLTAPWSLRYQPELNFHIVIINNGGGKIFQPMFHEPAFENNHGLEFAHWAAMWGLSYAVWSGGTWPGTQVVEIRPDPEQSEMLRKKW